VSDASTLESGGAATDRFRRLVRLTLAGALFWTALGLFFASQIYFLRRGMPWRVALLITMPLWYVWGLLTPAVFWVDKWLGARLSVPARVAAHVPVGIAWTMLSIVLCYLIRPFRAQFFEFFVGAVYWDLVIYAVIAGVAMSRDLAEQARQREAEAHRLALQRIALERRLTEAGLQTLRAQLHPHFLFNALNTISAFTETDPRTARRLMGQLGDLLRASLRHTSQPLVSLGEELTFLDDYLAIELARLEGRLIVSVHADDHLLGERVPSFLLQPLVENAIRHGITPRVSGGLVDVVIARSDSTLTVRVRDKGVGLPPGWHFERDAGVGLQNIASRLEHLYRRKDLLRIAPNASGGVDVRIDLPLQHGSASPVVSMQAAVNES
jgi:two-component system, LytTR family, sensor kinase